MDGCDNGVGFGGWALQRSIHICAPSDEVWERFASPGGMDLWWCPPPTVTITFEPMVGGTYTEAYDDGDRAYVVHGALTRFEPPCRFAVRRDVHDRFSPTAHVEFGLDEDDAATTVTLSHTFECLAPQDRPTVEDFYGAGWEDSLERLHDLVLSACE